MSSIFVGNLTCVNPCFTVFKFWCFAQYYSFWSDLDQINWLKAFSLTPPQSFIAHLANYYSLDFTKIYQFASFQLHLHWWHQSLWYYHQLLLNSCYFVKSLTANWSCVSEWFFQHGSWSSSDQSLLSMNRVAYLRASFPFWASFWRLDLNPCFRCWAFLESH